MKQLLFVFNPMAGGGRIKGRLMEVLCSFSAAGYHLHVFPTHAAGDAARIVQAHGEGMDLVVCSGGDGTLNEAVHGLMQLKKRPRFGYIPAGTTCDFATSLKLPKGRPVAAVQRILHPRRVYNCDIGSLNGRHFTYVAAFGAFTDVPYKTPQKTKNLLGYAAYLLEALGRLPSLRPFHVKLDCADGHFEDDYLLGMVANSASVAGFSFPDKHHRVRMDDGLMEILLVRHPQNVAQLGEVSASLLSGAPSPLVTTLRADWATLACGAPLAWTLDGEYGGSHGQSRLQVHRQALSICI